MPKADPGATNVAGRAVPLPAHPISGIAEGLPRPWSLVCALPDETLRCVCTSEVTR
ncbi:MAG: hypothetical protein KatS3mg008_1878 [Acidimicrobiales bacterium]|nr:MAG: hypothetical protein KatS3mg008_1878 [Acidimicrobiales bacterium]